MTSTLNEFNFAQRGLHGPAWRERLARSLPAQVVHSSAKNHDPLVVERRHYLTLCEGGPNSLERAREKFPLVAAAEALSADASTTSMLKLMVLADLPADEIQRRVAIEPAVLATWEGLFFDVRQMWESKGWLAAHVIDHERKYGNPALAARMRVALAGGPLVVAMLLDAEAGLPLDDAARLDDQRMRLHLMTDEALHMPLGSSQEAFAYVEMRAHLMVAEQRLELAERKFSQRCVEAARKFELDKLRLDLQFQRARTKETELQVRADRTRQREEAKRDQRQAAIATAQARRAADHTARAERIASSPLAKLVWGSAENTLANVSATLHVCQVEVEQEADTTNSLVSKHLAERPMVAPQVAGPVGQHEPRAIPA